MNNNAGENIPSSATGSQLGDLPQASLIHLALQNWRILATTTVIFLIVAFIYVVRATPIYTSSSRMYVEQSGPRIISEYDSIMTRAKNYLYTQVELIKSPSVLALVIEDPRIKKLKTFKGVDNPIGYLKKTVIVSVGKKDDILSISFDSPYPKEASNIVNVVVESYVDYHSSHKRSTAGQVLNILEKGKLVQDKLLSDKLNEMLEFTRANGVVSFDEKGGHIIFERLSKLSAALTEAQLASINAKADFEAIKKMSGEYAKIKQFAMAQPTLGIRVLVNDTETQLLNDLKNAEIELKTARYHCTEEHPSIKALHDKIDHIKQRLNDQAKEFSQAYTDIMHLRWKAAEQREIEFAASFEKQRKDAQELGVKAAEYSVLKLELARIERLFSTLDDRIKELNVTEESGAMNITVLEVARPADFPSKPKKAKVMGMMLIFGLMSGFGLILLRDWLDYRLQSADEIQLVLNLPVLGVVPSMSEEKSLGTPKTKVWDRIDPYIEKALEVINNTIAIITTSGKAKAIEISTKQRYSPLLPAEKEVIVERGQIVFLKPKSIVAEAYRTIRTAVFFGVPKEEARTILVTSPTQGDGKSSLVSNLAIAMANAGQKTLIIDADFRKPMQHNIFKIDDKKGLSSVFADMITLKDTIEPGPVELLDVLPCGQEVPNPSEILNSEAFAKTLQNLSKNYDRILVDSPPVLPVADSHILSAICDVTILVLRADKSTRKDSQHARDTLINVGARIIGAIVNDVSIKRGRYGYGSYKGYGSYGHHKYYGHSTE